MPPGLALLLGLGSPSQSSIWAAPGAVTPNGSSVTIFCRVPPGVTRLYLFRGEPGDMWHDINSEGAQDVVEFPLQNVVHTNAGTYHCVYWKQGVWAGFSESLELTVTGIYKDKPSLTAQPGPQVASGGDVMLLCQTPHFYDDFILCRDRGSSFPQDCSHQAHGSFLISSVSLGEGGTYRCYVSHRVYSCLWSLPSDPLDLSVTDYRLEHVIQLSLAALVLLVLVALLMDAWKNRRGL
ncbi:PREDICTED: platelet glycoprotein VI-like isoform X5 [Chinchilla lanigera]|uniref:platelet glycoprotein VI-like isoform X5 n=1 Tax=Chinchilla lanigera TaxID=34839 RepID=UPI000697955D|nr:PREDICTED: platelet glycoprotein VI-like isoform X5 [Chinchilla lanigera]